MDWRVLRYLLPLLFILIASGRVIYAQSTQDNAQVGGPPPGGGLHHGAPPSPAQELQHLSEALGLTEEQRTAILPILEARHTQIDALMKSDSGRTAAHEQMQSIMDSTNAQISALLTTAQQAIFVNMRPPHPPGDKGPDQTNSGGLGETAPQPPPDEESPQER